MAPSHVFDYIVVHEMCHMYYKNHSQEFWDMLASVLPDYERRKEWLKNYGVRMDLWVVCKGITNYYCVEEDIKKEYEESDMIDLLEERLGISVETWK